MGALKTYNELKQTNYQIIKLTTKAQKVLMPFQIR